jgi:hypothetical protein
VFSVGWGNYPIYFVPEKDKSRALQASKTPDRGMRGFSAPKINILQKEQKGKTT